MLPTLKNFFLSLCERAALLPERPSSFPTQTDRQFGGADRYLPYLRQTASFQARQDR